MQINRLAPLSEEPFNEEETRKLSKRSHAWKNWVKNLFFNKKSDLKILLSVLACPLFPVSLQPIQSIIQVSFSIFLSPFSLIMCSQINLQFSSFFFAMNFFSWGLLFCSFTRVDFLNLSELKLLKLTIRD